jgi:D-beta-D-heptose 7-phosphate kinase/D-beta-D-heptose 1-phosphate adenosyltransferase
MNKTSTPRIAVIGDYILDHYYLGDANRISPEAPIPVVLVKEESFILGGAGNVVRNLISFGVVVYPIGLLGEDLGADKVIDLLKEINVTTEFIIKSNCRPTTIKSRVVANNQQIVRIDKEATHEIFEESESFILNNLLIILSNLDIVILSDYGKGLLTNNLLSSIMSLCNQHDVRVIVDPKGKDFSKYRGAYLLTPNKLEASIATGINICDNKSIELAILKLKEIVNSNQQLITLGSEGIAFMEYAYRKFPAIAKEVYDVTGAGDTVISSLAFKLALGSSLEEAIIFANKAASIVVQKFGSAVASLNELNELEFSVSRKKIFQSITDFLTQHNTFQFGKKVVFTNGCFDILHTGHIKYLEEASTLGDILIVGLNSDNSVKKLKGLDRPVNNEEERATLLAAIEFVDFVILFEDDTPLHLIKTIRPDILVTDGDYPFEDIIGNDFVVETKIVPFSKGKSTSDLIDKIKKFH